MPRKPTRRSAGTRQEAAAPEAAKKPRPPRAKGAAPAPAPVLSPATAAPVPAPGAVAAAESAPAPAPAPSHDAIARLAREIWAGRGCPAGRDFEIWLEAERRLASGS